MDVSVDLIEFGRISVIVILFGVKFILDIRKIVEYLVIFVIIIYIVNICI